MKQQGMHGSRRNIAWSFQLNSDDFGIQRKIYHGSFEPWAGKVQDIQFVSMVKNAGYAMPFTAQIEIIWI
jgi:hypothetical protein